MTELNVTHVSTTDNEGGAAKCAYRLHEALPQAGVRSRMFVAQRFSGNGNVFQYNPLAPAPQALGQAAFRIGRRLYRPSTEKAGAYFSFDRTPAGWRLLGQLPPSDVVNLHWVADLLDYRTLPGLTERLPVVWTFHDMNAFTGGCHYSGACRRYAEKCGACPQLRISEGSDDLTGRSLERKRRILRRVDPARLTVVTPSRWLAGEATRSAVFGDFDVNVIPSGIDSEEFRPVERAEARRRFHLPPAARIALFVADFVADRRKGLNYLLKAVDALRDIPDLLFLTIGRGDTAAMRDPIFRHLGSLRETAALRAAYSAADVFVIPSLEDNFPNTVLEAMACGTPVVGFASGGIPEAVSDGRTGLLAPTGDGPALAPLLRRVLEDGRLQRDLGRESRATVERDYTIQQQARRYAGLYEEMREARAASRVEPGIAERVPQ
jgi:glycosyltransferase involved in cell wall biosynthesis